MMLVNTSMKEKYPMWYDAMEKQNKQQEIDNMLFMAKLEFSQFVDAKMKEIEDKVRELENNVNQASINIEATLNNQTITNSSAINREVKKMVMNELEKAIYKR